MAKPITASDVKKMTPPTIKKDRKLAAAILLWAKDRSIDENWLFLWDKGNADAVVQKYIRVGAKKEINISYKLRQGILHAHETGDTSGFDALLKDAKKEIWDLCKKGMDGYDTHAAVVAMNNDRERPDVERGYDANAKKLVKVLGLETSSKDDLAKVMTHVKFGETKEATKLLKKIDASMKLADLTKTLKKSGLM